jgi:hypothetical protein
MSVGLVNDWRMLILCGLICSFAIFKVIFAAGTCPMGLMAQYLDSSHADSFDILYVTISFVIRRICSPIQTFSYPTSRQLSRFPRCFLALYQNL